MGICVGYQPTYTVYDIPEIVMFILESTCNEHKKLEKDRLYVFATKLRQQFVGNLRSCTGHPDGGMGIKQRSNLLNDDNRILEPGF